MKFAFALKFAFWLWWENRIHWGHLPHSYRAGLSCRCRISLPLNVDAIQAQSACAHIALRSRYLALPSEQIEVHQNMLTDILVASTGIPAILSGRSASGQS